MKQDGEYMPEAILHLPQGAIADCHGNGPFRFSSFAAVCFPIVLLLVLYLLGSSLDLSPKHPKGFCHL